jgi:hypothetical protein
VAGSSAAGASVAGASVAGAGVAALWPEQEAIARANTSESKIAVSFFIILSSLSFKGAYAPDCAM